MRKMLGRLAIFALILAGLYLIPVNLALNLPVTQELLNELQPDRFSVGWKRAWSWYPLRVELRDLAADGQAPTEQWQLDAKAAGVSISLLALLEGEVRVHDLDIRDIRLRLRPRPIPGTAGTDSAGLAEYFPTIRSRDPAAPAETPSEEEGDSLHLAIDDFHVAGSHEFWVHQARGHVSGDLRGSFSLDTGTGRIGLSGGELNLALTELDIGSDRDVTGDARIRGRIDVPPANIAELSTVEVSKLPEIDAQIDAPLPDLHFVNLLFNTAGVMDLTGKGRLHGRLVYSGGEQRLGTDLMVEAPELRLSLGRFEFTGDGAVEMKSHESDESQGDLSVRFDTVDAYLKSGSGGDARRLFEGRNLSLSLHADTSESARKRKAEAQLTLSVPSMRVQDIALYNALIPTKWGVELMGGQGELSGRLVVGRQALVMELNLGSDETDVRFEDNRITTDLSLALRAQAKADTGANLDLTGTELRLGDVRLGGAGTKKAKPWQGGIKIDDGHVTVQIPAERSGVEPLSYLTETLEKQGFGKLLENADGHLGATLTVSQIDWIAGMLGRPLGLTLAGSGEIDAELVLADGRLARGTKLRIPRRRLQLGLLEHRVDGQGRADLGVVKSRGEPALRLDVAFADARVKRVAEERPAADKMQLKAEVLVPKSASKRGGTPVINLDIQSARIPDFGTFNAYFPPGTPVKLLSGEASLVGGVKMKPDDAKGELLVKVKDVRVAWDEEELSGDLRVNLLIHGGTPKDMRFDVSAPSEAWRFLPGASPGRERDREDFS